MEITEVPDCIRDNVDVQKWLVTFVKEELHDLRNQMSFHDKYFTNEQIEDRARLAVAKLTIINI